MDQRIRAQAHQRLNFPKVDNSPCPMVCSNWLGAVGSHGEAPFSSLVCASCHSFKMAKTVLPIFFSICFAFISLFS